MASHRPDQSPIRIVAALVATLIVITSGIVTPTEVCAQNRNQLPRQIVIYVNSVELSPTVIDFSISSVELNAGSEVLNLPIADRRAFRNELLDRQIRLVDESVSGGEYRSLWIESRCTYRVDDSLTLEGSIRTELPLNVILVNGEVLPLFLSIGVIAPMDTSDSVEVALEQTEGVIPPHTSLLFVSNQGSDNVSVVNKHTGIVVDVMTGGRGPSGMVVSRLAQELFVANSEDHTISVFEVATRHLTQRYRLNAGDRPTRLALSPDERFLYVLNSGSNTVAVIGANSLQEINRFDVEQGSVSLDVDPTSGWVYVSNEMSDNLTVYDPTTESIVTTLPTGSRPREFVLISSDTLVCIASSTQRGVTVISSLSGNVKGFIRTCGIVSGLVYDRIQRMAYATVTECNEVMSLQPTSLMAVTSTALPSEPARPTLDSDNRRLIIPLPKANQIAIVNLTGNRIVSVIDVGDSPYLAVVAQ